MSGTGSLDAFGRFDVECAPVWLDFGCAGMQSLTWPATIQPCESYKYSNVTGAQYLICVTAPVPSRVVRNVTRSA